MREASLKSTKTPHTRVHAESVCDFGGPLQKLFRLFAVIFLSFVDIFAIFVSVFFPLFSVVFFYVFCPFLNFFLSIFVFFSVFFRQYFKASAD